jgi:hypothetical protein
MTAAQVRKQSVRTAYTYHYSHVNMITLPLMLQGWCLWGPWRLLTIRATL